MTRVAMRPGGVIVCLFGAFFGGWRGNLGGRDKRRASFRHVGGWFDAIIPYGSGAPLPYISSENPYGAKTCSLAAAQRTPATAIFGFDRDEGGTRAGETDEGRVGRKGGR